ncbi:MAG: hypothetical protein IJM37_07460 [Lachnospiraceae bacterium]|nr:hypothetical protein [Lachnospiraceae bacterium]
MKFIFSHKLPVSIIISCVITAIGMLVNYIEYTNTNYLKWAFRMPGGECLNENGFGLNVFHTYAMSLEDTNSHHLTFSIISLILSIVVFAAVIFLLLFVIDKILKDR